MGFFRRGKAAPMIAPPAEEGRGLAEVFVSTSAGVTPIKFDYESADLAASTGTPTLRRVTVTAKRGRPLRAFVAPLILGLMVAGCATTPGVPNVTNPTGVAPTGASAPGSVDITNGGSGSPSIETTVCTFYFHFVLNANSSGTYRVETRRSGKVVMNGTWATGAAPDVRVPAAPDILSLPEGQYAISWTQDGAVGGVKQFAVACPGAG